jgi:hypothetical protein
MKLVPAILVLDAVAGQARTGDSSRTNSVPPIGALAVTKSPNGQGLAALPSRRRFRSVEPKPEVLMSVVWAASPGTIKRSSDVERHHSDRVVEPVSQN